MEDSHYDTLYETEHAHWWYRVRRRMVNDLLVRRRREAGESLNILDIGCGTGELSKEMQRYGSVSSVDISPRAVAYCREKGIDARLGSADALPYDSESFDVIVMLDVLEHLADDAKGAAEVVRVLRPGGLAIIAVPAYRFLWSVTDELSHHFRRYTKRQFVQCLKRAGLTIERATYFNTFLFPAIAGVRLAVRLLGISMESENRVGGPWINRLLYEIFLIESKLLPYVRFPFGVSLLAVARKNG